MDAMICSCARILPPQNPQWSFSCTVFGLLAWNVLVAAAVVDLFLLQLLCCHCHLHSVKESFGAWIWTWISSDVGLVFAWNRRLGNGCFRFRLF